MLDAILPALSLHPLHTGASSFEALSAEAISRVFVAADGQRSSNSEQDTGAANQYVRASRVAVTVHGQNLVLGPSWDGKVAEIPLLFSEVLHGTECKTGKPLLDLCVRSSAVHWLIEIDGDCNEVTCMLAVFGAAGAIRTDFAATFDVEPEPIGSGSNATVYAASKRHQGDEDVRVSIIEPTTFAVKLAHPGATVGNDLCYPKDVETEVTMLSAVQEHPNILRFCGLFCGTASEEEDNEDILLNPRWALVMERYSEGDLFDAVIQQRFSDSQARQTVAGLMQALAHIHERGIVHRDVKPENVLLGSRRKAILSDFGISCRISDTKEMLRQCGSPGYAAPELLSGRPYGAKVDVFSTGCLLFFLLSAQVPFEGGTLAQTLARTIRCVVDFNCSSAFKSVSNECKNFMLLVLTKLQEDRPSAEDALSDEWLLGSVPDPQQDRPVSTGQSTGRQLNISQLGPGCPLTPRSTRSNQNFSPWAPQQPERSRRWRLQTGEGPLDKCLQEASSKPSRGPGGSSGDEQGLSQRRHRRLQSWNGGSRMKGNVAGGDAGDRVAAAFAINSQAAQGSGQQQEAPPNWQRRRRSSVAGTLERPVQAPTADPLERRSQGRPRRGSNAGILEQPAQTPAADTSDRRTQIKRRGSDAHVEAAAAALASAQSASQQRASIATTPRQKLLLAVDTTPQGGSVRAATPRSGKLAPVRQEHRTISWAASKDAEAHTPRRGDRRMHTVAVTESLQANISAARNGMRPNDRRCRSGHNLGVAPPPPRTRNSTRCVGAAPALLNRSATSPVPSRISSRSPNLSRQSSGIGDGSKSPMPPWVDGKNSYSQELTACSHEQSCGLRPAESISTEVSKQDRVSPRLRVAHGADANLGHPVVPPSSMSLEDAFTTW